MVVLPLLFNVIAQAQVTSATEPCGARDDANRMCEAILRMTGNTTVARASDVLIIRPAKIGIIVFAAWLASRLAKRAIRRFTRGLGTVRADVASAVDRTAGTLLRTSPVASARAKQRAETIGALLGSMASFAVWTVAILMVAGELGLQIGPLLAGAGIAGIAFGFGAQNLVRDFISGIFMLIEDQYGVGDEINAGPATGVVEGVSLRTTRLRDEEGNVWHIPNGTIDHVANKSQQWSRALLDVQIAYGSDTAHATQVIKRVALAMWQEDEWADAIVEEPEVMGVESLTADGVTIRMRVKTRPRAQWRVARELRLRMKNAFDAEGIEIPFPQRVVWHRTEGGEVSTPRREPASEPAEPAPRR